MKKNLFFLIAGVLLCPAFVLAEVSYERSPGGYTIENPVNFDVAFDDFSDALCDPDTNYWTIRATNEEEFNFIENCLATSTLSNVFSGTLTLGEYLSVIVMSADTLENCEAGILGACVPLEENEDPIFEVVAGEEGPGLFTLPAEAITSTTAYIGDIFHDVGVFIFLFIALPLGFYIVKKWLAFMPK